MTDTETFTARLAEAEEALHRLLTGSQEERVRHGDSEVAYTQAKISDLRAYIAELKVQLGLTGGKRRARRVVFG